MRKALDQPAHIPTLSSTGEPLRIRVPDVPIPVVPLCYAQDPKTMARCDRQAGHGWLHTWELWNVCQSSNP